MVNTYSPKRLVVQVQGQQLTGFSDSDMVTISLDEEKFAKYISVDGQVSRSFNVANSGKFVISLNQTSKANQILSTLLSADVADNTGKLTFQMSVRDMNSPLTFYTGVDCWVSGMPESSFGKEIETREWTIEASSIIYNISGNGSSEILGAIGTGLGILGSLP
jgi:hypothetical protein